MPTHNQDLVKSTTDLLNEYCTFISHQTTDLIVANVEIKTLKRYIKKLKHELAMAETKNARPINGAISIARPIYAETVGQPINLHIPNYCSTCGSGKSDALIQYIQVEELKKLKSQLEALESENQRLLECLECQSTSSSESEIALHISSVSDSDSYSSDSSNSDCNCSNCNNHFTEDDSSDIDLSDTSSVSSVSSTAKTI